MEYRKLNLTIVSADNLPRVRPILPMRVYAVVSCNNSTFRTEVDMDNERNPRWRKSFDFLIDAASVRRRGTQVVVKLYCKRIWSRDKPVGDELAIELKSLFDKGVGDENNVTYPMPKGEGATLNILFDFGAVLVAKKSRDSSISSKIFRCVCPRVWRFLVVLVRVLDSKNRGSRLFMPIRGARW